MCPVQLAQPGLCELELTQVNSFLMKHPHLTPAAAAATTNSLKQLI